MKPVPIPPCLRAACLAAALAYGTTAAHASAYAWDAATGAFDLGTNWSNDIAPVAADDAELANGGTIQITSGSIAPASGFLNQLAVSNGFLAMTGGILNSGNLQVTGGSGIVDISGGIATISGGCSIAATHGRINISGSAEVHLPQLTLGSAAGVSGATMTVSGNAVVAMDQDGGNRELWIGGDNNGSGVLVLKDNAAWQFTRKDAATDFAIGRGSGSGVLTIQDNATLSYTGGAAAPAAIFVGGAPSSGGVAGTNPANAFNLNGGTVTAIGIHKFGTGTGTLNLNGGKIVAAGASADFFAGFSGSGGSGNNSANVLAGGLRFDSNGSVVASNSPLGGVGGLEKLGTGSLSLSGACTYRGDTTVSAGELILSTAFLRDDSKLTVKAGARVDLAHGIEDVIETLVLDGTTITSGTWGSTSSPAANQSPLLAGSGTLRVLAGGVPDAYLAWANLHGVSGDTANTDSDLDGIPNGIEFVIGGDPSGPDADSSALLPMVSTDATALNFVFRRTDDSAGESPAVEYAIDLAGTWSEAQGGVDGVVIDEVDDDFGPDIDRVTVRLPRALAGGGKIFARLRVILP